MQRIAGCQSRRRPDADNAAERRRYADGATKVGALRDRHHAGRRGHRRAAGRAGGAQRRIPRIARRAEQRVVGVGAAGEFGRIGLGKHDGAGGLEAADGFGVFRRHVVLEQRRGEGGADAGSRRDVLDRDRQAVQRAECLALHDGRFRAPGAFARLIRGQRDDGVELRIERRDDVEVRVEHVERTDGAGADEPRQFTRRFAHQSFVAHGRLYFPDQCTKRRSMSRNSRLSP